VSDDATMVRLQALLEAGLAAWRVAGDVRRDGSVIVVRAGVDELRIARAAPDLPVRWIVSMGARTRGVTSVVGVLRTVRAVADPGHQPVRLRVAPLVVAP
jgi:hypothetical protein